MTSANESVKKAEIIVPDLTKKCSEAGPKIEKQENLGTQSNNAYAERRVSAETKTGKIKAFKEQEEAVSVFMLINLLGN